LAPLLSLTAMAVPSCAEIVPIRSLPLAVDAWAALAGEACAERPGAGFELDGDGREGPGWECDAEHPPRASAAAVIAAPEPSAAYIRVRSGITRRIMASSASRGSPVPGQAGGGNPGTGSR
jgi:hypothetical protein